MNLKISTVINFKGQARIGKDDAEKRQIAREIYNCPNYTVKPVIEETNKFLSELREKTPETSNYIVRLKNIKGFFASDYTAIDKFKTLNLENQIQGIQLSVTNADSNTEIFCNSAVFGPAPGSGYSLIKVEDNLHSLFEQARKGMVNSHTPPQDDKICEAIFKMLA